jgi:hypothetical protein
MTKKPQIKNILFSSLPQEKQRQLLTEIHSVYQEVFDGLPLEQYIESKLSLPTKRIELHLVRDETKKLVGYNLILFFEEKIDHRRVAFIRSEAAMLPNVRGANRLSLIAIIDSLKHKLRHPTRESYFASMMISPSGYQSLSKLAKIAYPRHNETIPSHIERLRAWFIEFFKMRHPQKTNNPWLVESPLSPKETPEQQAAWREHPSPHVRFFLEQNPHYLEKQGLLFFIPLTWHNLLASWWNARLHRKKDRS